MFGRGAWCVFLHCALATPLAAQRPDSARSRVDSVALLPALEVHGSIVAAAGADVRAGVPTRVTVIDAGELRAWRPRTLPDVAARRPGLATYDDLGSPRKQTLSLRGFSAGPTVGLPQGVAVFLDGVRQNEADAQQVNFDLLPMEFVERVEVLRGGASLLDAHAATFGTFNDNRRTGTLERFLTPLQARTIVLGVGRSYQ